MPIHYVNRRGKTYHLLVGKTKTGKPKYYASTKSNGTPAESLPEGYEIYENPADAQVYVRKVRPSRLLPQERDEVARAVRSMTRQEHFFVEIDGDSLVVYWPDTPVSKAVKLIEVLADSVTPQRLRQFMENTVNYTALLRFTLIDPEERLFTAERFCFRGSIDDWIDIAGPAPLAAHLQAFIPHLGHDSFYELL